MFIITNLDEFRRLQQELEDHLADMQVISVRPSITDFARRFKVDLQDVEQRYLASWLVAEVARRRPGLASLLLDELRSASFPAGVDKAA